MPLQSHLAVPVKSIIGTGDFLYMLIKWLYLFWELPGLSMAVTDSFHKLTYFFHGICRNLCFHSSWLFLLLLFPLSPLTPPYHIWKIAFWHIWKWQGLWEVLSAPEFLCMFSAVNILAWDCPCLKYLLPVSVVTFTQIKSTSACGFWERAGEQFSDSCVLNAGGFMNAFSVWLSTLTITHSFFQMNWNELNCLIKSYLPG